MSYAGSEGCPFACKWAVDKQTISCGYEIAKREALASLPSQCFSLIVESD
jgi:hypothetical protein